MKVLLSMTLMAFSAARVQAQDRINGTVFDSDGKTPLSGASVVVKNRGIGAITDAHGNYTIAVFPEDVLVIGYLGYDEQETEVRERKKVDVTLVSSNFEMEELVVTALGLTRQQRSLGYATTTVSGDDLTQTGSGNWVDALSGRVAGLKLDQAGTGSMGSIRATIRGDNSLNYGNNEVLVVVDGVPIHTGGVETSSGSNYSNSDAPVDFGNGLSDLNADDIESITVLKGAAATALYGSRAGNGAFIITTKAAKKPKGLGISVSSTTSFDRVMRWPDFQKEYGGGNDNGEVEYSFWTVGAANATDGNAYRRNQGRYAFGEKYDARKLRIQVSLAQLGE
ncbi:MAG: TonB-dependent receptor plug domain-containing protein [Rikenellaceae bacterium]|nr:TonB-dependent receptor plug domain-containing protein [Rikenellaceae bacterium]